MTAKYKSPWYLTGRAFWVLIPALVGGCICMSVLLDRAATLYSTKDTHCDCQQESSDE